MKLSIITPERIAFEGEVDSLTLPTSNGEIQILPGHIPLLTGVQAGTLEASMGGSIELLAVGDGFAEVVDDHVKVLTTQAVDVTEIDLASIEAARDRAQKELEDAIDKNFDPAEIEQLHGSYRFALAQQLAKGKRRF